jgi:hypothetical protein
VVQAGFMTDWQTGLVTVGEDPPVLLKSLVEQAGFNPPDLLERI